MPILYYAAETLARPTVEPGLVSGVVMLVSLYRILMRKKVSPKKVLDAMV